MLAWLALLLTSPEVRAQQLEPRAYSPAPIGMNFLGVAAAYTGGGVLTDPALPIENVSAHIYAVAPFYVRTFNLFGRLANISLAVPYAWLTASGDTQEGTQAVDRSGFLDPQLRLATNLIGGPALTPEEFRKRPPETTLGASVTVQAPLGQYDSSKLVNLGTNRWGFRAEIGFSQPVGPWRFELCTGAWFFTTNDDFRGQTRKQEALASMQAHVVYIFGPGFWAAGDFVYYEGGATTVGSQSKDDRQANVRVGLTLAAPITSSQSVKLGWSQGATTRIGSNFTAIGLSWNLLWN
jgi:hypothetical protein